MSKYNNIRTQLDGITFDSKVEAERFAFLKLMQRAGEISGLERQPRFKLAVNGEHVTTYVADFRYVDKQGRTIIEDVKGVRTPAFNIKAKLFRAIFGFDITLSGKGRAA